MIGKMVLVLILLSSTLCYGGVDELVVYKKQYTDSQLEIVKTMGKLITVLDKLISGVDEEGYTLTPEAKAFIKAKYLPLYNSLPAGDFKTEVLAIWNQL